MRQYVSISSTASAYPYPYMVDYQDLHLSHLTHQSNATVLLIRNASQSRAAASFINSHIMLNYKNNHNHTNNNNTTQTQSQQHHDHDHDAHTVPASGCG